MKRFQSITILLFFALGLSAQVGINTTGSNADASAMLDVKSTSKGVLIPRMTSAQRIAIYSPATGLLVYDTSTDSFWFYDGGWNELGAAGGGVWQETSAGNIYNTSADNVFIGTSGGIGAKLEVKTTAASQFGIYSSSSTNRGVMGVSTSNIGVQGSSENHYGLYGNSDNFDAIKGFSNVYTGVIGESDGSGPSAMGVRGISTDGMGVNGLSTNNYGVLGQSTGGAGVRGESTNSTGVTGFSTNSTGVYAYSTNGKGLAAYSADNIAVEGITVNGFAAIDGRGTDSRGLWAESTNLNAIEAFTPGTVYGILAHSSFGTGVYGVGQNYGIKGRNFGFAYAGYFEGNVYTTGTYSSSDRMLKQNEAKVGDALAIIEQLRPKTYTYRTEEYQSMNLPEGQRYGFIAQDLEKVLPQLVKTTEAELFDEDAHLKQMQAAYAKGEEISLMPEIERTIEFKAVNYTEIIPILVGAVQEQQVQIEALKAALQALQND